MARFIKSNFNEKALNVDLVRSMKKFHFVRNGNIVYAIYFDGIDEGWHYDSVKDRDAEFDWIISLFGEESIVKKL